MSESKVLPENSIEVLPEKLWVKEKAKDFWVEFEFMEFYEECEGVVKVQTFMTAEGLLGGLNELRHTWWGEDGYIFYPSIKSIRAALDWLEKKGFEVE